MTYGRDSQGFIDCLEQGSELAGLALPAAALLVSRGPAAMWFCHMDVGKESKKVAKGLLGGKKVGLLRLCLTDLAYEERTSRPALCAVSILRAADCMLGAVRAMMPSVAVGKILIQRDHDTAKRRGAEAQAEAKRLAEEEAAEALRSLAHNNPSNQLAIATGLVALLGTGTAEGQEQVTKMLTQRVHSALGHSFQSCDLA